MSEANAIPGAIIISCSQSGAGHLGIVGEAGSGGKGKTRVYSNSSSHALFMHNYTIDDWRADFGGLSRRVLRTQSEVLPRRKRSRTPVLPGPPLQQGSCGEDVRSVQEQLNKRGNRLEVDGVFGPATHQAVIAFQKKAGLAADGIVGPKTWDAL